MKPPTFRQMKIFEAVARLRSFTRAAETLYLTQPTVSTQIRQLSEIIGLPLIEQIGKQIYLTEAGRELYATCREVFDDLARLDTRIANLKGLNQGTLHLAIITTAKYFVPHLLEKFCRVYPQIESSLQIVNREQALQRLQDNLDDLYILGQPPEHLDVIFHPFMENPLVVIAARQHPLADAKHISLARLVQEPFLVREPGSGTRMALLRLMEQHGLSLNIRMELGSQEVIKQAVSAGLGLAALSRHVLPQDPTSEGVTILDVENFPILRHWYIVHPAGKRLSVVAQSFFNFLRQEGEHMNAGMSGNAPRRPLPLVQHAGSGGPRPAEPPARPSRR